MGKKRKRTGGNKVKIGLVDCDSHNFPNLPLMKLSAYHKKAGDCVSFARMEESYDRLYVSKIFTESPEPVLPVCGQVIRGGRTLVLCQEKVQIKCNQFSLF
ncbi:hypothetical protein CDL26_16595 [Mediterraneibacter gnavus]|uniref:Uncharacterized protein n=1 Tax=Mediterraneibacter gnavus TaxID=33038 RepID=A0A2N5NY50_MEDGN|nr:hypothetical protein CDL26_16595 [Mediterraneibacter gnavus]